MSRWIAIDPQELKTTRTEKIRGVDVQVYVSPYDVPEKVSGYYDSGINRFVILFRYKEEDEATEPGAKDDHIKLYVGQNSQRLLRIEIDVDALQAERVQVQLLPAAVDKAINHLGMTGERRVRQGNYALAKEIVSKKRKELFEHLGV